MAAGTYPAARKLLELDVAAFAPLTDQREWEVRARCELLRLASFGALF